MNARTMTLMVVIIAALLLASTTLFVVSEKERAVVLRFGALQQADVAAGLHVKLPWDSVRRFDGRILTVDAAPESFFTLQQKRLEVDSFAKWRISDVTRYYRATGGDERVAASRLASRINDGLRNEFGLRTLHEVVSGERDQLMEDITTRLNETVHEELGIDIVDVRVKRVNLPVEVSRSVFERMQAERTEEATEYRSLGREESEKIRADADRQTTIITAEAYREAEKVRGEGDAQAAAIYAAAYSKDPEFYAFTRSLKAYENSFSNKQDLMLVAPDSEFFRFLKSNDSDR